MDEEGHAEGLTPTETGSAEGVREQQQRERRGRSPEHEERRDEETERAIRGHTNPYHHARGRCESGGNHSRQYADGGNFEEEDQQPPQQNHPPQQDHQPQQHGFPDFQPHYECHIYETVQGIESHLSSMQFSQQTFYENMQKSQADYMEEVKQIKEKQEHIYQHNQRFHAQVWKEHEKLAKEIQEVRRGQMTQVAANNQRFEAEKNLQLALERQGRDIIEIRKQVNLWTNNVSSKEAYACWAQQQANPNLSEVP
ncbi:hypothetical protein PIB30_079083 [Stylosanthes scabra]|uniref:Uncharacterized protein n=1 Tax=Stylosanthes scabra TaxID=79078 RepID=A0ABU6VPH4_9FABA|nr:hypothetical protein [Stylosanthes scabra]